ncbi:MAG: glutaredoxin family protein [Candidatus Aenigmarchaeota archaeon]|nr:glutaredoxin family protein [Candidatus Aenigmarchaeota archaeon]
MSVTIFTTPTCIWCKRAKEFFKEHKIAYKEVDVSVDQKAAEYMIEKTQQMGVPVIEANGEFIVGFDEPRLRTVLRI